jgi:hypothetical protein
MEQLAHNRQYGRVGLGRRCSGWLPEHSLRVLGKAFAPERCIDDLFQLIRNPRRIGEHAPRRGGVELGLKVGTHGFAFDGRSCPWGVWWVDFFGGGLMVDGVVCWCGMFGIVVWVRVVA